MKKEYSAWVIFTSDKKEEVYSFNQIKELIGKSDIDAAEIGKEKVVSVVTRKRRGKQPEETHPAKIYKFSDNYADLVAELKQETLGMVSRRGNPKAAGVVDVLKSAGSKTTKNDLLRHEREIKSIVAKEMESIKETLLPSLVKKFSPPSGSESGSMSQLPSSPDNTTEAEHSENEPHTYAAPLSSSMIQEFENKNRELKLKVQDLEQQLQQEREKRIRAELQLDDSLSLRSHIKALKGFWNTMKDSQVTILASGSPGGEDVDLQIMPHISFEAQKVRSQRELFSTKSCEADKTISTENNDKDRNDDIEDPYLSDDEKTQFDGEFGYSQQDEDERSSSQKHQSAFGTPPSSQSVTSGSAPVTNHSSPLPSIDDVNFQNDGIASSSSTVDTSNSPLSSATAQESAEEVETPATQNSSNSSSGRSRKTSTPLHIFNNPMYDKLHNKLEAQLRYKNAAQVSKFDEEIYPLQHGLFMPAKTRIFIERCSKSACMMSKNIFRCILTDEALLWCTMDGAQKGGRIKLGAMPAVHDFIKEATWYEVKLTASRVVERAKQMEKSLKERNQPLPPLLDAKKVPIQEKILDLWVGAKASEKAMKNECGKIFAAAREKEKKKCAALAERLNVVGTQTASQNPATSLFVPPTQY